MAVITMMYVVAGLLVVNMILLLSDRQKSQNSVADLERLLRQQADHTEQMIRQELVHSRRENSENYKQQHEMLGIRLNDYGNQNAKLLQSIQNQLAHSGEDLKRRFAEFQQNSQKTLSDVRFEVGKHLSDIQKDNSAQLEKMRLTVDEKLHKTLEERLGQSFQIVSHSLEKVQKGLGEMQSLASGVGDLKKVLSNVKTRGVLGEIQLGTILDQLLTPDQYALNVATIPHSSNHVEFAIKFPGKGDDEKHVWLPIDAKFPLDRYDKLVNAYEDGTPQDIDKAQAELIRTVKLMAREIQSKYISPPHTTDFGVMFLPIEGLYAEVARHPGLVEVMQRDYRILIAGPTNLAAFLNSLQLGFRSLAIEKRSSEVWKILAAVKQEFGKFGEVLAKTQKKLQEASNVIDKAGVRTRAIERKLRKVEELPQGSDSSLYDEPEQKPNY